MQRGIWYVLGVIGIALMLSIAWFLAHPTPAPEPAPSVATTTPNLTGSEIYTNGAFAFSLIYPSSATATDTFSGYYHLPAVWSAVALPQATGTPAVAIVAYRTERTHAYPRYFDAEVRVGVSDDASTVSQCLQTVPNNGETVLPDTIINGVPWHTSAFESAGMMQYLKGVSYRAVHDGRCYALEKLETGSNYRDDPPSSDDVPQATLDNAYASLDAIIQSFSFAR